MRKLWVIVLAVGLGSAPIARADLVILYNGDRIEGQIVEESTEEISLMRTSKSGNIRYIEKIRLATVVRIERTGAPKVSQTKSAENKESPTTTRASSETINLSSIPSHEQQDILAAVMEGFKQKAFNKVGTKITRLISNATPGQLFHLSAKVERELKMTLAELAAEIHYQQATNKSMGQKAIRFRYVSNYEKHALAKLIEQAYDKALKQEIRPVKDESIKQKERDDTLKPSSQPSSQPAEEAEVADVIAYWIDKPVDYDGEEASCEAFGSHIRYTMSLLRERMRLDPALRINRTLRMQLLGEKADLNALQQAVKARKKGALTPAERTAILARRKELLEQYQREMERQRMEQQVHARKAIREVEDLLKREKLEKRFDTDMERQRTLEELRKQYYDDVIEQQRKQLNDQSALQGEMQKTDKEAQP